MIGRQIVFVVAWLRGVIAAEWLGPSDLPRSLTMEWRLIAARWVGMIVVAPVLPVLDLPTERLVAAYTILLFAVGYNVTIRWYMQRWPDLFANGYLTTFADSVLNIAMVLVGGGFDSPFSYVLFTVTISVAMRYGYGPALAMTLLFTAADVVESVIFGHKLDRNSHFAAGSCSSRRCWPAICAA